MSSTYMLSVMLDLALIKGQDLNRNNCTRSFEVLWMLVKTVLNWTARV